MGKRQIYAVYRHDKNITDGTAEQVAYELGVTPETIRKLATPSYQTRNKKGQKVVVVRLGKEDINHEQIKKS